MKREVGLCLVFRDMWQSSCRYFPSAARLREMAYVIASIGCFDRVETNGGAFEQVCLMQGENPNLAVREFTAPLKKAGIKTQMLERGLNALRLNPVPADVRELMFKVKSAQGVDVARSFCGLNDHRNLRLSIEYAKSAGMISQVALPVADSPVHTIGHYMQLVSHAVEYGCDEICIKDMSGQGKPSFMAELIRRIKAAYPELSVQYHSHSGGSSSRESLLEAVRAGADCVDVALGPLAGGVSHPEVLDVVQWLREAGFVVKDVDMEAYRCLLSLINDCLSVRSDDSDSSGVHCARASVCDTLCAAGLPGGMIASLVNELPSYHLAVNDALKMSGAPSFLSVPSVSSCPSMLSEQSSLLVPSGLTFSQFVARFADEVRHVWPALGYPPMVTPFSQYVANAALSNLVSLAKGQPRWSGLSLDVWNMILGRMGQLPGNLDAELVALAEDKGLEFYGGDPQLLYPSALDRYRTMMLAEGWTPGPDEEELLEFAMHETQYRDYMTALSSSCCGIRSSHSCVSSANSGISLVQPAVIDSGNMIQESAVYAAIAMALHEYLSTEISSWD